MQVHFLVTSVSPSPAYPCAMPTPDAAAHISAYPRSVRKVLHLSPIRSSRAFTASPHTYAHAQPITASIASWSSTASFPGDALILAANTVDPDMDITSAQEFSDIDDEFAGLTICTPADEVALFEFCTGYAVL